MKACTSLAALGCLLVSPVVMATLGGNVSSVETDRARMKAAAVTTTSTALYSVHEMQTAAGTRVREFANAGGIVFAVTWQGPFPPDLRQTLGSYFEEYRSAPRNGPTGHAVDSVAQPDLVVHAGGHLRAFAGSAYDPRLVPAGVAIEALLQGGP